MVGPNGRLQEGVTSNIFLVKDGVLVTPSLAAGILAGVTRADVLALAQAAGRRAEERELTVDDLWVADEAFLTSTLMEVLPITHADGRPFGDARPGPVTAELARAYTRLVHRELGL